MRSYLLLAAFTVIQAISSAPEAAEPDQYLCVEEHAAGVRYSQQTNAWGPQAFLPSQKFLLRRLKGDEKEGRYPTENSDDYVIWFGQRAEKDKSEWGLFPLGEKLPSATCNASFQCTSQSSFFMHFNKSTGRFEASQLSGYYYQPRPTDEPFPNPENEKIRLKAMNHPDDGVIMIGTCTAF